MPAFIKTAALSLLIGLGALAVSPASAQSGGVYLGFGTGKPGTSMGFHFGERGHHDYRDRHYRRGGECSSREAARKAHRMGLRDVRVRSGQRTVRADGRTRGHRHATVVFANVRGCPVIR